jgi:hypothetical protein
MVISYRSQRLAVLESIHRDLSLPVWQIGNRQCQIVRCVVQGREFCRLGETDLLLARRSGCLADVLQHGVEDRPSEVRLGIGQAGRIVRAGSLDQGEIPLTLQVFHVHRTLPLRTLRHKVPGEDLHQLKILSDQFLPFL